MIKFFRKIRQKGIKENKIINYLKYAIGEIVLVVIGILIALNINNQNGERLKKEKLDTIYIEVQRELALNIERTTTAIDFFEKKDSIVYLIHLKNPPALQVVMS
jgi:sensor domain CHASE-containing protein